MQGLCNLTSDRCRQPSYMMLHGMPFRAHGDRAARLCSLSMYSFKGVDLLQSTPEQQRVRVCRQLDIKRKIDNFRNVSTVVSPRVRTWWQSVRSRRMIQTTITTSAFVGGSDRERGCCFLPKPA